jgi:dihydrofolate reductase
MGMSIIVAMTREGIIGAENALPWHLPEDLAHFKRVTLGRPVVMGRKTYESIGRPLPGRRNIMITRDQAYDAPGCERTDSLEKALQLAKSAADGAEYFVIGGGEIYAQALPQAERLYVTWVEAEVAGDTRFPAVDWEQWHQLSSQQFQKDERHDHAFEISCYQHKGI